MNLLKPALASAAMLVGGVAVSTPETADAQIRFSIGNSGYGYGNSYYGNGGYRSYNNFGYGRNYGYGGYGGYGFNNGYYGGRHSHGHYDYHPTTVVPHGNHYDVIPGHYDWHDTSYGRGHHGH